jgi:predicted esterase
MLHGRGASPDSILTLVPRLARPAWTYVAPAAAGGTWYPFSFLTETSRNEPFLSSALRRVGEVIADLEGAGTVRERIVLLGFSQGACLASEWAVRHAGPLGGVIAFSGGLIGPPGTTWPESGRFAGTSVFLGCSDVDSHIPRERVEQSAEVFRRMGAEVAMRLYPNMGHLVNEDEILQAQTLMDSVQRPVPDGR